MKTLFLTVLLALLGLNTNAQDQINWMSLSEAVELNKKTPKKIFIDFYTSWCGWCKKMDASTFSNPKIVQYMNANYYAVKFNAETKETVKFNGNSYTFSEAGRRGANQLAIDLASSNGRLGYPTVVVLGENLNKLNAFPGFKDVTAMDKILKYYGEGYYDDGKTWQQFNQLHANPE